MSKKPPAQREQGSAPVRKGEKKAMYAMTLICAVIAVIGWVIHSSPLLWANLVIEFMVITYIVQRFRRGGRS